MKNLARFCTASTLLVSACSGSGGPTTKEAATAAGTIAGNFRIAQSDLCPFVQTAPEIAPLLGAILAPVLVEGAKALVGAAGDALVTAGQDKTVYYPVTRSFYFYEIDKDAKLNPNASCLIIYKLNESAQGLSGEFAVAEQKVRLEDLDIKKDPDFYLEAYLSPSTDGTAFRLTPTHFVYAKNLWQSNFTDEREIVLSFDFMKPSTSSGTAFASTVLTIPGAKPGMPPLTDAGFGKASMVYMPMPAMEEPGKAALEARKDRSTKLAAAEEVLRPRSPNEQALDQAQIDLALATASKEQKEQFDAKTKIETIKKRIVEDNAHATLSKFAEEPSATLSTPVNLRVLIAEARAGSELAAKAGAVLKAASGDINKATASFINDRLLPSQVDGNRATKTAADQKGQLAVLQAQSDVLAALQMLAALGASPPPEQRAVAELNVKIAKQKYIFACINAGNPSACSEAPF